jgi:hypothetical protein
MRFSFSTESLVPEERFENFRDTLVRGLFQLDLENRPSSVRSTAPRRNSPAPIS